MSRRNHLRAEGNLTYMQFIRLVQNLWENTHKGIPILPTGSDDKVKYPCILYGLELRKTRDTESKPRLREVIADDEGDTYVVTAQRFENIISFTAMTEGDPVLAEELIETFELFMQEVTPILKEMGTSDMFYARRYADSEQSRPGEGVVMRKVAYMVVLERVTSVKKDQIKNLLIRARVSFSAMSDDDGESVFNFDPRYYTMGGQPPTFYQTNADITDSVISAPFTNFRPYDRVYVAPLYGRPGPPNLVPGFYYISNIVGVPFSDDVKYELTEDSATPTPVTDYGPPGTGGPGDAVYFGKIIYVPVSDVEKTLVDTHQQGPL